jgi:lipopolysaccharide transport system permease protein
MSSPALTPAARPAMTTVIEPTGSWANLRLGEVWRARELIFFLIWRDIKVRYKQTAIGAGWAVLQPLITVVIFSLLLGRYAHLPTGGVSYPIFVFAGLLPWMYFAYSVTQSGKSLVDNEKLVTRLYFPRLALPIATTFTGIPDFLVGCVVFAAMMGIFGVAPTWHIIFMPLFFLLAIATALGVGLWLSGLNVRYRDVKYVLPFLTQIWMFASPVVYSGHVVTGYFSVFGVTVGKATLYSLNPMSGVINGFRWALLKFKAPTCLHEAHAQCLKDWAAYHANSTPPSVGILAASTGVAAFLLVTGVYYFKHMDKSSADVI